MSRPNSERARITLDAIEVMDALSGGDWTVSDVIQVSDLEELIDGLREYASFLEALMIARGSTVQDVRNAGRETANRLARRAG